MIRAIRSTPVAIPLPIPIGPFIKSETGPVLKGKGVVKGAGHHSVVKVPGRTNGI